MAKEVRIPVPGGIVGHGQTFKEVILREPRLEEYWDLGEIVSVAKAPDGTIFWVENAEIFRGYLDKCLVSPNDPLLLGQGDLLLARNIKDAILGFFSRATSAAALSPTSATTSSSDASQAVSPQTP